MSLAQDIRNAYDMRDRDALERLLAKVQAMEQVVGKLIPLQTRSAAGDASPRLPG